MRRQWYTQNNLYVLWKFGYFSMLNRFEVFRVMKVIITWLTADFFGNGYSYPLVKSYLSDNNRSIAVKFNRR